MAYNLTQIQSLLRQAGWPENLIAKYAAIVMYESGGDPNQHNTRGEDSYGLLQIYYRYHTDFDRSRYNDPLYNLRYAYGVYQGEHDHGWITSVGKYNRDYQGIASRSRAIYNAGGGNNLVRQTVSNSPTINAIANNIPPPQNDDQRLTGATWGQDLFIVVAVGLGALLVWGQFED